MNAVEWERIRRNLDKIKEIQAGDIIPALFASGVLETREKENLYAISSNDDRMTSLCQLLKEKPQEKQSYRFFVEALRQSELSYDREIADILESTVTTSDPSIASKVNPSHFEEKARQVLNRHFTDTDGAETALSDFRDVLCRNKVFSGGNSWTNKDLGSFIKNLFARVEIKKKAKRTGNHSNKLDYVINVAKLDVPIEEATDFGLIESEDKPSDTIPSVDIKLQSPSQLKAFLHPYFEKENIAKELDELENQDVSGAVFLSMTDSDLKDVLPHVTFGVRRRILFILNELKDLRMTKLEQSPEFLREFDKDVQPDEFYTQGRLADITVPPRGKKLVPIKNFHFLENQPCSEKCIYIAVEVMQFAAACINSRRNGTIYFGISPETTQLHQAGEIVGMSISQDELQMEVKQILQQAFHRDQYKIVDDVIKPVQYVTVRYKNDFGKHEKKENLFVIEFDLIPLTSIVKGETIRVHPKPFPFLSRRHRGTSCTFDFSDDGKPKVLNFDDERDLDAKRSETIAQRELEEKKKVVRRSPNLRERLHNRVTGGHPTLQDDIYPFLLLGPMEDDGNSDAQKDKMSFVKHLLPEVVFDFNEKGSSSAIYHQLDLSENFRILTTDNFDSKVHSKTEINDLTQSLADEKFCRWVFCNGDEPNDMKALEATQWNKQRKCAFQEAMKCQLEKFKKERILLFICLFSQNEGAIVEASDEILSHLPDQWILLAESKKVAQTWQHIILQRNKVEKEDLADRCVVGMTWKQVSDCFQDWSPGNVHANKFQIVRSNGSFVEVNEKLKKSWCDIDIPCATSPINPNEEKDRLDQEAKAVEEHFYRGGEVKWENFWFKGQVLERTMHQQVKREVEKALQGKDEKYEGKVTSSVYFYHQPGAGGTTLGKQVLWELRTEYRCCVIDDITDQTPDQLEQLYMFEDEHLKPLLLFLDNKEDEKLDQFRYQMEIKGRNIQTRLEGASEIFCVLFICSRRASLSPEKYRFDRKFLRQELDSQELSWFKNKNEAIKRRYAKNSKDNVDPRFLISFNLLKKNFDRNYLRHLVEVFMTEITDRNEIMVMEIVSMLNKFDSQFRAIPVSCFDILLDTQQTIFQNTHNSYGKLCRTIHWEARVSQSFKVLLNLSSHNNPNQPRCKTIRVFNKLLAEEILETLKRIRNTKVHDIMLRLLQSRLFEEDNGDIKTIQKIIRHVIIKRQAKKESHGSSKKESFSDLLLSIKENGSVEKAMDVLKMFYEVKNDPGIAQQIARLYIDLKNYDEAEKYAYFATNMQTNNSYFWDTYGQVFFHQLMDKIEDKKGNVNLPNFSTEEFFVLLTLFQKCLHYFRESQKCTELEREFGGDDNFNFVCYMNELRATEVFLGALEMCSCFPSKQVLHVFLVDYEFKPATVQFLNSAYTNFLKSMQFTSWDIIQKLEEAMMNQRFERKKNDIETDELDSNERSLSKLKTNLDDYFGESLNHVPPGLNEQKQCEFRYRRALSKIPKTLMALLKVPIQKIQILEQNFHFLSTNVRSQCCGFYDLKAMLDFFTVLVVNKRVPTYTNPIDICNYTKNLCFDHEPRTIKNIYPEKFFYFILYNFPCGDGQVPGTCVHNLISAIENLKKAFLKKNANKDFKLHTERPIFYLGNGAAFRFQHLVYHEDLRKINEGTNLHDLWKIEQVVRHLKKLSGTLQKDGTTIKFVIKTVDGNKLPISIPTLPPVKNKLLWQKTVHFYLGFSFAGLKAVGITTT